MREREFYGEGGILAKVALSGRASMQQKLVLGPSQYFNIMTEIKNLSTRDGAPTAIDVMVVFVCYYGSALPGHGDEWGRRFIGPITLAAGGIFRVTSPDFRTPALMPARAGQDVGIFVTYEGKQIISKEWDDVFELKVIAPVISPQVELGYPAIYLA